MTNQSVVITADMAALEAAAARASETARRVWYLADGVYSMYGDVEGRLSGTGLTPGSARYAGPPDVESGATRLVEFDDE